MTTQNPAQNRFGNSNNREKTKTKRCIGMGVGFGSTYPEKKIGIKEKARQNVTKTVQKYTLHRAVVAVQFERVQELRRVSPLTIYKWLLKK